MAKGSVATNVVLKNDEIVVLQAQLGDWDNLNHLLVCLETRTAVIIDPLMQNFGLRFALKMVGSWNRLG